jgi:anti-sigma regulatory factor (Ser/Thr protein kinase)
LTWFRLPEDDEAVKKARRFTGERLDGAEPEFVDDVLLCVSELLGNAVRYARVTGRPSRHADPGIWLGVQPLSRWVHLYARDPYPVPPRRRTAGAEDESGRGVFIVSMLAAAFWTELRRFDKTVHVVLARPGVTLTEDELERIASR